VGKSRVHRPPLERTGPIRDFRNVLAGPTGTVNAKEPRQTSGGGVPSDFIGDGVRMAYRVIDAYVRQGQEAARQFTQGGYGVPNANAGSPDPQMRATQLLTDLVANSFDLLGLYSESLSPPPAAGSEASPVQERSAVPPNPGRDSEVQLAYEVASSQPVLVFGEFLPGRHTIDVASHGLRQLGSDAPEIGVSCKPDPDAGRVVVAIKVPDARPVGVYTGLLVRKRDGTPVGSLSLTIRDSAS
jgi:hypothetical protein